MDTLRYASVPIIEKRTGNVSFPVRMPTLLDDYEERRLNEWVAKLLVLRPSAVALNQSGAHWPKSAHVAMAVVEFIESYCNRRRPHSTIGYRIPAEAMDGFFGRTAPHVDGTSNQDSGKLAMAA